MTGRTIAGAIALAAGVMCNATVGTSQSQPPKEGPAVGGSPAWFLQPSFPDPTGRTVVDAQGNVTIPPREAASGRGGAVSAAPGVTETPACRRSPVCGNRVGRTRQSLQRVQWR